jgi:predicted secreted Zn-dependent protease
MGVVFMRKAIVLGFAVFSLVCTQAQAKPSQSTRYKFYNITGDSPVEIYSAMIKRGPDVNGVNAYASTSATSSQSGQLIAQGKSCRVDDYSFRIDFTINLPKLKNEQALQGQLASKWGQFKGFLKSHEEQHRTIWLGCARDLETQVRSLRTTDCKGLDKKAAQLWKSMRASCDKKHAAFDAAEQKRLMKHPFVRMVLGQRVHSTKALSAN